MDHEGFEGVGQAGTESIWDYPQPPRLERTARHVVVAFNGEELAESHRAWRVVELGRPPAYYVPREDVRMEYLKLARRRTWCVWRGIAHYYNLSVAGERSRHAAWTYLHPPPALADLKGLIAFYPDRVDACYLDGERVRTVEGSFFGGWITSELIGPFDVEPPTEDVRIRS